MITDTVLTHIYEIISASNIGTFALSQGRFIYTNRALQDICGYRENELLNFPFLKLLDDASDDLVSILADRPTLPQYPPLCIDSRIKNRSGEVKFVEVATTWQIINQEMIVLGTIYDLTERREAEEQMRMMSQRDPLTGLVNRNLFLEITEKLLALAERNNENLAILFLDLDQFKQINDQNGHEVGDRILQETAKRISGCIRKSDTACRIGGDEFVVLLQNIPAQEVAFQIGEKIRLAIMQAFPVGDIHYSVSSSIGISIFPEHGKNEADLIRWADQAMYRAKRAGKNRISA